MTKDDILKRTTVCGDCLIWTGSLVHHNAPVISLGSKKPYVKRYLLMLAGANLDGKCVSSGCGEQLCVNPAHLVVATKASFSRTNAKNRVYSNAIRAKFAQAKRRDSKLSDAAVVDIRCSAEPVPQLALRHGISATYAYMIRRGEWRRDYSNPFAGLFS